MNWINQIYLIVDYCLETGFSLLLHGSLLVTSCVLRHDLFERICIAKRFNNEYTRHVIDDIRDFVSPHIQSFNKPIRHQINGDSLIKEQRTIVKDLLSSPFSTFSKCNILRPRVAANQISAMQSQCCGCNSAFSTKEALLHCCQ